MAEWRSFMAKKIWLSIHVSGCEMSYLLAKKTNAHTNCV